MVDTEAFEMVSGAGEVAELAQVEWQSRGADRSTGPRAVGGSVIESRRRAPLAAPLDRVRRSLRSRPLPANSLRGRPVAVVGASTSIFGAVWAQAEVRKVLAAAGAYVLDAELPVARAADAFDADGALRDPDLRARLAEITGELVGAAVPELQAA
jgi:hypothetical protein